MTFFKRLLRIFSAVLLLGAIGLGVLYHLSTRTPGNYNPLALTDEQRAAAASRAEQKLPDLLNLANKAHANANSAHLAQAAGRPVPPDAARAVDPLTVSFTQDELNAFLWKWSSDYKATYERYAKDPFISLENGEIVLMGTVPEFGRVASAYFKPRIDDQGLLHCDLDRLRVGNLPFPEAMIAKHKAKVEYHLKLRLPTWRANAKMEPNGSTNTDAAAAAAGQFILNALYHRPSPAALFLPRDINHPSKTFPVRITQVAVDKGALTITVQPMTTAERTALLQQIRQPTPSAAAAAPAPPVAAE